MTKHDIIKHLTVAFPLSKELSAVECVALWDSAIGGLPHTSLGIEWDKLNAVPIDIDELQINEKSNTIVERNSFILCDRYEDVGIQLASDHTLGRVAEVLFMVPAGFYVITAQCIIEIKMIGTVYIAQL